MSPLQTGRPADRAARQAPLPGLVRWRAPAVLLAALLAPSVATRAVAGPAEAAQASAPKADEAASPEQGGQAGPTFDVWEYVVAGNQALPGETVERAVYPFLGPGRRIEDVEAARAGLEAAYREAGYGTVLVNIPEQDVVEGVVRLEVVEGRVSRLKVTGSRYFSLGGIRSQVPALAEGEVPRLPEVQEQLTALNAASTDRRVTPVLRPGATPGELEVELKVQDELPLHGALELNDRYGRDTTRTRLEGTVRYDNLWQREHSASLSYQVAPENRADVEVFSGTYLFRVPESELMVVLYGVGTNSDVATVGTLGVVGKGRIFGLRGILPLGPRERYFHSLVLGADYKDFEESVALLGADSLNTPIDYTKFNAGYDATWLGEKARTRFNAEAHFALRGFGNQDSEFQDKRFRAEPNFAFLTAGLEHERELARGAEVLARLRGQVAAGPLVSNEQFNAGGVDSVRGYLESQALGDEGLTGTLELRSPSIARHLWSALSELRFHAFAEAAQLRTLEALGGQAQSARLASVGLGLRASALSGVEAELEWAYPLEPSDPVAVGEQRVHFKVGYSF